MGLRYKVLLIIIATLISLISVFYFASRQIILTDFIKLETEDARYKLSQARDGLQAIIDNLHVKSSDWAIWDDNYQFIQNHNQGFIDSNMQDQTFANLKLNFMLFLDLKGQVVYKKAADLVSGLEMPFPEELIRLLQEHRLFFSETDLQGEYSGIILLAEHPLLISIRPILKSDNTGPVRGTLVFAKYLTTEVQKDLAQTTHLKIRIRKFHETESSPLLEKVKQSLSQNEYVFETTQSETLEGFIAIADLFKNPALILSAEVPRYIYQEGLKTMQYILAALVATGVILMVTLFFAIKKYVIVRLVRLDHEVYEIEREKKFSGRVHVTGNDELSHLKHSINSMLKSLEGKILEVEHLNTHLQETQDQLLQSQKMESVGRLAGGIAHDFNNVLSGILGYSSLLLDQFKDDTKVSKKLGIIKKSAERGAELTRSLLGFARKGKYEKKVFNVNDIVLEVQALLSGSVDRRVRMKHQLASDLKSIEGDSTQISQILINLAINACDAMPEGGEVIVMSENLIVKASDLPHHHQLKEGAYVHVSFRDTGTGIPPEILPKVFDPFFTTKEAGKGSGLGLAMTYGIMQNHHGSIAIDSTVGVGTTIHLYFQAISGGVTEEKNSSKESAPLAEEIIFPSVILIAEDEIVLHELYQEMFSKMSPKTKLFLAHDGMEALELFKQHSSEIELLVMDVIMPNMDGIKAFKEISNIRSGMKTIFISGYAESAAIASLREDGRVAFIQKPLKEEKLLSVMRSLMGMRSRPKIPVVKSMSETTAHISL